VFGQLKLAFSKRLHVIATGWEYGWMWYICGQQF